MSKVCKGGAHDGANIYLEAHARECVSNGGVVVEEGNCVGDAISGPTPPGGDAGGTSQALSQSDMMDQIALFPLRALRTQFLDTPLMHRLDQANERFAGEIIHLCDHDPDLQADVRALLLAISATAASVLESRANPAIGAFTISDDLAERCRSVAARIQATSNDDELNHLLDQGTEMASALAGVSIAEIGAFIERWDEGSAAG